MTKTHSRLMAIVVAVCAVGLSACGSSKSSTPTTTPTTAAADTSAPAATDTSAPASTGASDSAAAGGPAMTLDPAGPYSPGQTVTVSATGFKPNDQVGINECADKGNATGAGDCDLAKIVLITADANGAGSSKYVVHVGPFGQNQVKCSATQKCLLSVSELIATGGLNTSQPIEFK